MINKVPIGFLLLFAVLITACTTNNQPDTPKVYPESSNKESESTPNNLNAPLIFQDNNSIPNDKLVPLFYAGQLCHWVREIFQDNNGIIWLGTNHYGVIRYNGDTLEYFAEKAGVESSRISGMVEDKAGNVWFATSGGLTKYDQAAEQTGEVFFINYPVPKGPDINEIWCVTIDRSGKFWVGTTKGVYQFDGETYTPFPIPQAEVKEPTSIISNKRVSCILEDKYGKLWFGTDGYGICIYDPSALNKEKPFTHLTKDNGLCDNNVADLLEDEAGNIWIGTMYGGVSRYNPSALSRQGSDPFTNYTKDGLVNGIEVYGFYEDKNSHIWFAAENHGVYRYDPSSASGFINYYTEDGLTTNGIQAIYEDQEGRFWLGGWKGLFRYDAAAEQSGGKSIYPVTKDGPWEE